MADIARLQKVLGYQFDNVELLQLALTHCSAGNQNNERLEFLGDSILNHIVAEALYLRYPSANEGEMSRMRASLVKGETLAEIARDLTLGDFLVLGVGERKSGGHRRNSILADTLEAIIGAILLDSDVERCRGTVLAWVEPRLQVLSASADNKDAKTRLQEFLQGRNYPLPQYDLLGVQGSDHAQQFKVACRLSTPQLVAEGKGSSRRRAEQDAAMTALERLTRNGD
ncbi:MAG: ribonuclease III [Halioglobus sp.]|nr:ribonuclease III [Halioglobus sp.]